MQINRFVSKLCQSCNLIWFGDPVGRCWQMWMPGAVLAWGLMGSVQQPIDLSWFRPLGHLALKGGWLLEAKTLFSWKCAFACYTNTLECLLLLLFFFSKQITGFFWSFFLSLWLYWVFVSVWGLSLVAASGGHSSSRCAGLSLSWPLLLRSKAPDAQAQ